MTTDRVTNKQLYEGLNELRQEVQKRTPTRLEMRLTIAVAVLASSGISSALASYFYGQSPSQQLSSLAHLVTAVF